jgi:exodeoxyribonuclease V alpha subunit
MSLLDVDAYDIRLARRAVGVLHEFNEAGVLSAADVHVALRLGQLAGTNDGAVLLGAALAVRAPRLGHVCVDLATIAATASTDLDLPIDLQALAWPAPGD